MDEKKVRITNRYDFLTLDHLNLSWSITADGKVLETGQLPVPKLAPGETGTVTIPYAELAGLPATDYWLTLRFTLASDCSWAPAGHEVAWAQFKLPVDVSSGPVILMDAMPDLSLSQSNTCLEIKGETFQLSFDKVYGLITSWLHHGRPIITRGPRLNFWRAPTDNDVVYVKEWKRARLNQLQHRVDEVVVEAAKKHVQVKLRTRIAPPVLDHGFDCTYIYTIYGDGNVMLEVQGKTPGTAAGSAPYRPADDFAHRS